MKSMEELISEARSSIGNDWKVRDARKVPSLESLSLTGKDAAEFEATVLYADMNGSTQLVRGYKNWFAAGVYKTYLHTASEIIRNNAGVVTAFDGDRVMAVFVGGRKNTSAVKSAMQIVFAINQLNKFIAEKFPDATYKIRHSIGVDTGHLFVVRAGVRDSNDLVWVGEPANVAAKLTTMDDATYPIWITRKVYDNMNDSVRFSSQKELMWTAVQELTFGRNVLKSSWWWRVD